MSKIDKYFYKWDSSKSDSMVHLGDSKKQLLLSSFIKESFTEDQEKVYVGIKGDPWRIVFSNDLVYNIWYNRENSFQIFGTELMGEEFNSVKGIIENNFDNLNNRIKNVKEMNLYKDSDILYIVCRDFFIILIAVIRPN